MTTLTRTAAKTAARVLLNEPTARYHTESALNSWCNDAVGDISSKTWCHQIRATAIDTVVGTFEYDYPTTFNATAVVTMGVRTITNSANVSLNFVTPDQIGKVTENPDAMGWTTWGRKVILTPVPTVVNQLNFWCWIQGEQTGAGALNLPTPYHYLVPLYIAYKGHEAKQNINLAKSFWEEYNAELQAIQKTFGVAENPQLNFVKPGMVSQTVGT